MKIFVGSTNTVKIQAIEIAVSRHWPDAEIEGFEVESGVPAQPMNDEETRRGSENRARAVLAAAMKKYPELKECIGVGMEGGIFEHDGDMYSTVWVSVIDLNGEMFSANGARFKLPEALAARIRRGEEMGPAAAHLTGIDEVGKKQGMIGIVTDTFVTRAEEYGAIARLAIGLWNGRKNVMKINNLNRA